MAMTKGEEVGGGRGRLNNVKRRMKDYGVREVELAQGTL